MSFEDELSERLSRRADGVQARPDLGEVEAGARRHRSRRRLLAGAGLAAVVALVVGSLVLVRSADDDRIVSTADATPPVTDDVPPAADPSADAVLATDPAPAPAATTTTEVPLVEGDPANDYLGQTTEVYRRTIDGRTVVVRRGEASWAEMFGVEWPFDWGSAEVCLGDGVLLVGEPGTTNWWGSSWHPFPEFDEAPFGIERRSYYGGGPDLPPLELEVVALDIEATEVAVLDAQRVEVDRAPVAGGIAVLLGGAALYSVTGGQSPAILPIVDGVPGEPIDFVNLGAPTSVLLECEPPAAPLLPLPEAGEQPSDPVSAEAEVRTRHALLIDRTNEDDPDDLLDDDTGVAAAAEAIADGPYAESAAQAQYEINEVVFTAPDEAWFHYTIRAPTGTFERYGIARHDGSVWQITRSTVCQDLALAASPCTPPPDPEVVLPPEPDGWQETVQLWNEQYEILHEVSFCTPINPCPRELVED